METFVGRGSVVRRSDCADKMCYFENEEWTEVHFVIGH